MWLVEMRSHGVGRPDEMRKRDTDTETREEGPGTAEAEAEGLPLHAKHRPRPASGGSQEGLSPGVPEGPRPCSTLIQDFRPPDRERMGFCYLSRSACGRLFQPNSYS